ncbi:MAG: hypothetical protein AAF153_01975, partial [Pseudomonadota bacterium]
ADFAGRKLCAAIGFIGVIAFAGLNAWFINQGKFSQFSFYATTSFLAMMRISAMAILKQSIPKAIRYRIFSMAHACGSIILSGTTPFIATLIYRQTGIAWLPLGYFIIVMTMLFSSLLLIGRVGQSYTMTNEQNYIQAGA